MNKFNFDYFIIFKANQIMLKFFILILHFNFYSILQLQQFLFYLKFLLIIFKNFQILLIFPLIFKIKFNFFVIFLTFYFFNIHTRFFNYIFSSLDFTKQ